MPKISDDL